MLADSGDAHSAAWARKSEARSRQDLGSAMTTAPAAAMRPAGGWRGPPSVPSQASMPGKAIPTASRSRSDCRPAPGPWGLR